MQKRKTYLDLLREHVDIEKTLEIQIEMRYRIFVLESQKDLKVALALIDSKEDAARHLKSCIRFSEELTSQTILASKPTKEEKNEYEEFHKKIWYMYQNSFITDVQRYTNEIQVKLDRSIRDWFTYRENMLPLNIR